MLSGEVCTVLGCSQERAGLDADDAADVGELVEVERALPLRRRLSVNLAMPAAVAISRCDVPADLIALFVTWASRVPNARASSMMMAVVGMVVGSVLVVVMVVLPSWLGLLGSPRSTLARRLGSLWVR